MKDSLVSLALFLLMAATIALILWAVLRWLPSGDYSCRPYVTEPGMSCSPYHVLVVRDHVALCECKPEDAGQ